MMVHSPQYPEVCLTNCALGQERVVDDDNPFFDTPSLFKKDQRVSVQPPGMNDILSFLELHLLLMTQVSLCSRNFLIFHAVAFFFLSSGTLKMALPGQSDHLIFTQQSLINDKITALYQMEVTASRTCTFSFSRKVLISMITRMKDSNIWLN